MKNLEMCHTVLDLCSTHPLKNKTNEKSFYKVLRDNLQLWAEAVQFINWFTWKTLKTVMNAVFNFCVSVVIMCMSSILIGGEDQRELLLAALDMGMVSDGYVFIPYDALLYAMPYQVTDHFSTKQIDQ